MTRQSKGKAKPKASVVIVAAGGSSRMGGVDKIKTLLSGKSVLERCVAAFAASQGIYEIIIVTREDLIEYASEIAHRCGNGKVSAVIKGGKSRTESAYFGVMQADRKAEILLIHDGARPLVTEDIMDGAIKTAAAFGAALPAVTVKDTIKIGEDGFITSTPDRRSLYIAQTPQAFQAELIKAALTDAINSGTEFTDDCAAVEKMGVRVHLSTGSYRNIKITTPEDLDIAESLLLHSQTTRSDNMRIGQGYDVHKLISGRKLILCGVDIPYEKGLLGHSDADVAVHALMDAMLGAAGLGDIGRHFPDTDMQFEGISSLLLLKRVNDLLKSACYKVSNADITIVAQKPKLALFIPQMVINIAEAINTDKNNINVKATTEEGMGFTGSGEGIAAHAVVLIEKNEF